MKIVTNTDGEIRYFFLKETNGVFVCCPGVLAS